MEVLFLTRLYYPHVGGVEKQVSELSKRLIKRGFSVSILTEKFNDSLKNRENVDEVEICRIKYPNIRFIGLIYIWFWMLFNIKLIRDSDIVHTHGVFIWYLPFRFIFPNKPIYTTFHGWEGIYPIPKKNILLRKIAARMVWKNITICDYVEKHYGIKADQIMYTSVDPPKRKKFRKDRKRIVYTGRLDEDTGLPLILKALSYLKGFKVDFCGEGPLRNECEKYGNVHGFTNPDPFLEKAWICLSPGHTSILEAFTHKCLIVTTYNNPVKKDYLLMTPFKKWIVVEKDPKKMAQKIKFYSDNPDKAKMMVRDAYKWVLTQNWDSATETYLKLWGVN